MKITTLVNKLHNDYDSETRTNKTLVYSFLYNGYATHVYYTKEDEKENQLLVEINIDNTLYIFTLPFICLDDEYYMSCYLSHDFYMVFRDTLLLNTKSHHTTPYFKQLSDSILNSTAMLSTPPQTLGKHNIKKKNNKNKEDYIYFHTIVRKPMSPKMAKKIRNIFPTQIALAIFEFCGTTMTLRFTNDIHKAKDIIARIKS